MEGIWKQTMLSWKIKNLDFMNITVYSFSAIQEFLDKVGLEYKAKQTATEQITLLFSVWCSDQQ